MKILGPVFLVAVIAVAIQAVAPLENHHRGGDATASVQDSSLSVVNSGMSAYRINGVNNPTLTLTRGETYHFEINAKGHPFYIKTARTTGVGNQYSNGVTGQGEEGATLTFVVPLNAPSILFYQCGVHSAMGGTISIVDPVSVPGVVIPGIAWLDPAFPNPTRHGTLFQFGLQGPSQIELVLFDERGRRVRQLANRFEAAGQHAVRWDGRDDEGRIAPSGFYHYRLMVDDRALTGRLAVTR